jgi:DNA-binding response OmpR family regulator
VHHRNDSASLFLLAKMECRHAITEEDDNGTLILVPEDIEGTRDGIEALLKAEGHCVHPARHEADGVAKARRERPRLILVSLGGLEADVIAAAFQTRERAGLGRDVLIVVFSMDTIAEGAEVDIGRDVHLTRPDNFDQLKAYLGKLLN